MMNTKAIALGVAVLVTVTTLCGALLFAQFHHESSTPINLEGRWSLTYIESVSLLDTTGEFILDPDDCEIVSYGVDPMVNNIVLEVSSVNNKFFKGKIGGNEIYGDVVGNTSFSYQRVIESEHDGKPHLIIVRGVIHETHVSIAFNQFVMTDRGPEKLCHAGYALFVHENGELVTPRTDRVDYKMELELVSSRMHNVHDFDEGMDPRGKDMHSTLTYAKSRSMISLFNMTGPTEAGLMAIISLGRTKDGGANGITAANMVSNSGGSAQEYSFMGESIMADGALTVTAYHVQTGSPAFIMYKFNVPYDSGTLPTLAHILKEYKGEVKIWGTDGPETHQISKTFTVVGDVVFGKEVTSDGTVYEWLGHVYGRYVHFMVSSEKLTGVLTGGIGANGEFVLSGTLYSKDQSLVYHYRLVPLS